MFIYRLRLLLAAITLCASGLTWSAPSRIVSLDLCMDWILAHHAEPTQVAALSQMYHRYPVQWITGEWPYHDGSLEQIVRLQPDLVLAGEYTALLLRERLRTLGYRVKVLALP